MKKTFANILCSIGLLSIGIAFAGEPTLTDQLRVRAEAARAQMPADATARMEQAIQSLRDSGIEAHALKQGDTMPDFTLPGVDGKPVSSKVLRKKGPLVVVFYRGAALLIATQHVTPTLVNMAWAFVALRAVHSAIHCTINRVQLRGMVYMLSTLVIFAMWIMFALAV